MGSELEVYVDGSWSDPLNSYSYGAVVIRDGRVIDSLMGSGSDTKYTESRQIAGECFGAIAGIHWAKEHGYSSVTVYYDYLGIEKWATGYWKARKQVSKDYQTFYKTLSKDISITFSKVKAHTGVEFNELADELAKKALGISKRGGKLSG